MTTPKSTGAAYNALMEEETKESLALTVIGLLGLPIAAVISWIKERF